MKEIEQNVRGYLNLATVYALLMVLIGLLFVLFPDLVNGLIRWSLTSILIFSGIYFIIKDFTRSTPNIFSSAVAGAMMLVMGLVIAFHPAVLDIVPILIGIWMVVTGVSNLRIATAFKGVDSSAFTLAVISPIVSILAGIFMIIRPGIGGLAVTAVIGIMIMIYAISSLLDIAVFRRNFDTLTDYVKTLKKRK